MQNKADTDRLDTIDLSKENVSEIICEVVNAKAASAENQGKRTPKHRTRTSKNATTVSFLVYSF